MNANYSEITIELTYKCNFKCIHCYNAFCNNNNQYLLLKEIINIEEKLRGLDLIRYYLTGGEPLLNPDFIEIYKYLYDQGYQIALATNGSLIDKKILNLFKCFPPYILNISLYGFDDLSYKAVTGAHVYDKILNNLFELKNQGTEFFIKYVAMNVNSNIEEVNRLLMKIDVPSSIYCEITPDRKAGNNNQIYQLSGDLLEKMILNSRKYFSPGQYIDPDHTNIGVEDCHVWSSTFVISPDGFIRPCIPCPPNNSHHILRIDINMIPDYLKTLHNDNSMYPDSCKECLIKYKCQCPLILKKYNELKNVCDVTKQRMRTTG